MAPPPPASAPNAAARTTISQSRSVHCRAALDAGEIRNSQVRVEAIVPRQESDAVLANLRSKLAANCALTVFVDEVQVIKIANFDLAGETKPAHS